MSHTMRRALGPLAAGLLIVAASCAPSGQQAASAGASPAASGAPPKVTLRSAANGTQPTATYLWLTHDAGVFDKHGLSLDLTTLTGAAAIAALVGGDID